MSSLVSVPVLSKQHTSTCARSHSHHVTTLPPRSALCALTFPAKGIRKGSVQKMPLLMSATREVLTAMDSSMGSSGGMTEVMMREHLRKSL